LNYNDKDEEEDKKKKKKMMKLIQGVLLLIGGKHDINFENYTQHTYIIYITNS